MNWLKPKDTAQLTDCGKYSVCRIGDNGRRTYEAWRTRKHPDGPKCLGVGLQTAEAARRTCEAAHD